MATAAVGPVEPVCVPAIEPVHSFREIRIRSLHDEVIVVRHQHPRGERPAEPLHRDAEEKEELLAVADGAKDRPGLLATGGNVIQSASANSSRSGLAMMSPRIPRQTHSSEEIPMA